MKEKKIKEVKLKVTAKMARPGVRGRESVLYQQECNKPEKWKSKLSGNLVKTNKLSFLDRPQLKLPESGESRAEDGMNE